jgi:hypothetical protein
MTDAELTKLLKVKFGQAKKANGDWVQIKCPTCSPRDAGKCRRGVNLRTLYTKCWICEDPITIQELLGETKIERIESSDVEEKVENPQARILPCDSIIPINELPPDHAAVKFFAKDHLTDLNRYWSENNIGYIAPEAAHDLIFVKEDYTSRISAADSLIFPVYYKKQLVGWQMRFLPGTPNGDKMAKFRYMHLFPKGDHLYNYDVAKEYDTVVVVEGVKKALKFPNGVATWGKSISERQIQMLMNWKQIVFMYDGEDETQAKQRQLVSEMNIGSRKCIGIDPRKYNYDSPDDMPEDVAQQIVYVEWLNQTKK